MTLATPETLPATETVLANARLVLADEVVLGSLVIRDGRIAGLDQGGSAAPGVIDCGGDLLAPGLVELHTDNLERHLVPRPKTRWPDAPAIIAHDGELAASGITTVFDALRTGSMSKEAAAGAEWDSYARPVAREIARLAEAGALRISHFLHLRAEVCSETVLEELEGFAGDALVRIVSMMDHTPGDRQFRDLEVYKAYYQGKHGLSDAEMDGFIAFRTRLREERGGAHIAGIAAATRGFGAVLASHDDTTLAHVAESAGLGVRFAEFPTTREAAEACRAAGIAIMMGAPNLLRGGSHSGNVAAAELVEAGLVDILSSDYVPGALLLAGIRLGEMTGNLATGFATVTSNAARAAGLGDRGEIAPGLRADLIRVAPVGGAHVVRGSWVAGERVA